MIILHADVQPLPAGETHHEVKTVIPTTVDDHVSGQIRRMVELGLEALNKE